MEVYQNKYQCRSQKGNLHKHTLFFMELNFHANATYAFMQTHTPVYRCSAIICSSVYHHYYVIHIQLKCLILFEICKMYAVHKVCEPNRYTSSEFLFTRIYIIWIIFASQKHCYWMNAISKIYSVEYVKKIALASPCDSLPRKKIRKTLEQLIISALNKNI